ncbi:MAG: hypothetical protein K8L99_28220, partial [Anaerolineae bacterium]|nr:hypothetical protein [Anaerolineae bacterium]
PDEYIEKRTQLQREMEALRPVEYDDLMEAADLLANFNTYWEQCANLDNPEEARKQLLAKIVDRVFVYDQQVIAVALHGDFGVILDEELSVPAEVLEAVAEEIKKGENISENVSTQCGSDGHGSLTGCVVWVPQNSIYHIMLRQHLVALAVYA